jgi:hypothetical protein
LIAGTRTAVGASLAILVGCAPAGGGPGENGDAGVPRLEVSRTTDALHLRGRLTGSFPGLGPDLRLEAWLRGDGWARLDLRYEDDEGPAHEVLLWSRNSCLLFDAHTGRMAELGDGGGGLEALGNRFELRDAVFLLSGLDVRYPGDEEAEFVGDARRSRAVRPSGVLSRDAGTTRLTWRADEGVTHYIQATYNDQFRTDWGPWPLRVEFSGTDLAAAARLHWEAPGPIVALGDSILDPLWEPAVR